MMCASKLFPGGKKSEKLREGVIAIVGKWFFSVTICWNCPEIRCVFLVVGFLLLLLLLLLPAFSLPLPGLALETQKTRETADASEEIGLSRVASYQVKTRGFPFRACHESLALFCHRCCRGSTGVGWLVKYLRIGSYFVEVSVVALGEIV